MKFYFIFLLFLNLFHFSLEVVLIWNMKSATIDLKSSFSNNKLSYATISFSGHDLSGTIRKELTIDGDTIYKKNYLSISGESEFEVSYEDIESAYSVINKRVICPKGRNYPQVLNGHNFQGIDLTSTSYAEKGNWDLKCYFHGAGISDSGKGFLMLFFLMNGKKASYNSDFNKDSSKFNWEASKSNDGAIGDELYDFKLVYGEQAFDWTNNNFIEYKMNGLVFEDNSLKLKGYFVKFESKSDKRDGIQIYSANEGLTLTSSRKYNQAYINHGDTLNDFYFISYNNISDFTCGYSKKGFYTDNFHYFKEIEVEIFSDSPFEFIDEVEITEMQIISNYRYVYYKINNKQTGENYYGLFDIKTNKIMFNTNVSLDTFLPYSSNSMLAIKGNEVYRICPIMSGDENNCLEDCTEGLLIRDVDKNFCGTECPNNKYLLVPDNICNSECDTSIYVVDEENKQCGLCKDMNEEKPYRFIGGNICLSEEEIPEGGYEYNSKLKLLKCKSGYKTDPSNVNSCVTNCHNSCKTCSEYSTNDSDPKCLTCNIGYNFEDGKCIKIITTIPEVIIPSTLPLQNPTTIPFQIPSTPIPPIITTNPQFEPSTIITNAPTTVIPPVITTIPQFEPSTIITNAPTTVINIAPTNPQVCPDEKCLTCSEESNKLGLCLSCNTALGYKKVNYTIILTNFLNCMKPENPQTKKYYFNETLGVYRPCYKTCKQCSKEGNPEKNYCLECENGYMFRPGNNVYNNCVAYSEFYYISNYNQYKSLAVYQCPEEAKYYIKERKSCIDNCEKDEVYKYLYNGNCLKECPEGTRADNYVCIVNDDKCTLGKNEIYLSEKDNLEIIVTLVKSYISEFYYTDNYISLYNNEKYRVMIYKNGDCITELSVEMPNVDFQSCYEKVKTKYNIDQRLIIVIVEKLELNNAQTFYSFYHPLSGFKLDADEVCKNETIVVTESLNSVLAKNDTNVYEAQNSLISQGINIFDLNDPFYTDLCYDFDNPIKKDIPLNDRIKILYPDVELCDDGCEIKGINLEDMTSTCDCLFNDLSNSNIIKENPLMESAFGEVFDLINNSNILVLKCFKNIFTHFSSSIGGWITLSLILGQSGLTLTFFLVQSTQVNKYLFNLTKNYIKFIKTKKPKAPPKKVMSYENKSDKLKSQTKTEKKTKNRKNLEIIKDKINFEKNSAQNIIVPFEDKNMKSSEDLNIKTKDNFSTKEEKSETEETFDKNFFKEYMSTSPEDMEFDDAVAKDKRKYCEHMKENLIEDQLITAAFIAEDPIKPRTIKIMVFILHLILYFVINGFFFSESFISELYNVNEEDENFFSYLPRSIDKILYTALVSVVIGIITGFFFVDEKKLKGIFRREKDNLNILKQKVKEFMKDLKRRYIAFTIVASLILIISFFYLLCFNYVYPYSQMEWIKSSITIFIIMQILSLLKCILETSMRFLSYKFNSEKLYKISKFLD